MKIQLQFLEVRGPNPDLDSAFQAAKQRQRRRNYDDDHSPLFRRKKADRRACRQITGCHAIYFQKEFVDEGWLPHVLSARTYADLFRRAAAYVDKILKGAKPADLPVQQPTKFEFVINLKAAKQIGLTLSPDVSRAGESSDQVTAKNQAAMPGLN